MPGVVAAAAAPRGREDREHQDGDAGADHPGVAEEPADTGQQTTGDRSGVPFGVLGQQRQWPSSATAALAWNWLRKPVVRSVPIR